MHKAAKAEYDRTHPHKKKPEQPAAPSATASVATPVHTRATSGRASGGAGAATLYESDDDDTDVDDALGAQSRHSAAAGSDGSGADGNGANGGGTAQGAESNTVTDLDDEEQDNFEESPGRGSIDSVPAMQQQSLIAVADV